MAPTSRHQFALPTLLAAMALFALWYCWAETVVEIIEHTERREDSAPVMSEASPVVVFPVR
jgi:hypothetical protein